MHALLKTDPGSREPAAAASRSRLGLRARLVLLVLSLLIPALLVAGILLWDSARQSYRAQERQLVATTRTVSLVVDRQLSEQTGLLNALASSYRLREGDWAAFDEQARLALKGSSSWVGVRSTDGQQLVNTLVPRGAPLTRVTLPRTPANDPPRADGIRVSGLAQGALAREPVVVVVKTVRLTDGREADLSIVTPARAFSALLLGQNLPEGWLAVLLDGEHRVIARIRLEEQLRGQSASGPLVRHLESSTSGLIWSVTLDGMRTRTAFARVPNSDWNVVVAAPRSELVGPGQRSFALGAGLALVLLTAGVALASRMASRISRGVEGLRQATASGVGEAFTQPAPTGVAELDALAQAFEAAAARVRAREAQQRLLMNELNHRVKNTLATIQSVAKHSRDSAKTVDQFHEALEGRILAMSGAHELLTRSDWASADLHELARSALKPFEGPRLRIDGPKVEVEPTDALNLALIFYELATNAAKYGALSGDAGQVELTWTADRDTVEVQWRESGGPAVAPRSRKGFGSRLIDRARQSLQPSTFDHHPDGVRCSLTLRSRRADG